MSPDVHPRRQPMVRLAVAIGMALASPARCVRGSRSPVVGAAGRSHRISQPESWARPRGDSACHSLPGDRCPASQPVAQRFLQTLDQLESHHGGGSLRDSEADVDHRAGCRRGLHESDHGIPPTYSCPAGMAMIHLTFFDAGRQTATVQLGQTGCAGETLYIAGKPPEGWAPRAWPAV